MNDKELAGRVAELTDRAEITELVARFFGSIDDRQRAPEEHPFDAAWARAFFTEDVEFRYPVGAYTGHAAELMDLTMDNFGRTQHLAGIPEIALDGDRAAVRWSAVHHHVHPASTQEARGDRLGETFVSGGHYDAEAVRTPDGWRFRAVSLSVAWTTGKPPLVPPERRAAMARLAAS
ncbi:nuclear transport factor 2 family protein [Actinomadura montaniterrae]|uniref:Nuclear transport factor 2 family protein n=1 Tax=Actinomadura montaniterrae TaxID=1803903 RepID=A0A6L3VX82_9ACTN|nr:nuclear transport factor 2 family protein [Actinomadura montaniterrae]KAB2379728.1 nuclear transport factor 2 family protein [Actinomadura montaniterrae]